MSYTRTTLAVWEITLACPLTCSHCGSRAGNARRDELTTAERWTWSASSQKWAFAKSR